MSPYYRIENEYRVIILNGECLLIYGKKLPLVVGNGKKTIKQLLIDFNKNYYFKSLKDPKYDRILKDGETYCENWKFNLSQGSNIFDVNDINLRNELISLAVKTAKAINLNFGSIDIIRLKETNKLLILEANSGVMFDNFINLHPNGYEICKNIYNKAIDNVFLDK